MPKILEINGIKIGLGKKELINLNIAHLPSRTPIDVPIHVFRAKKDGPVLLLLAGMHGDEVGGAEIIRRMVEGKEFNKLKTGSIIAIPILNVYGFLNFSRQLPDGKDVNRTFPGNRSGSLASRIAWRFANHLFNRADYILDFHTGGGSRTNFPQVRCVLDDGMNDEMAKAFSPPFIINAKLREKSLRWYASKQGKPLLVYEAGESLRFYEHGIQEGINGCRRFMRYLNMVELAPRGNKSIFLYKTNWIRARMAGIFHPKIESGAKVVKGQILGELTDPYGTVNKKVKAPYSGYIIAVNYLPVVYRGDALFHIGH